MAKIGHVEGIDAGEREAARLGLKVIDAPICHATAVAFGNEDQTVAVPLRVDVLNVTK